MTTNIRDLLQGPPHPSESYTMRDFLAEEKTYERRTDPGDPFVGAMPGDPAHPLARTARNPIPGVGVQTYARALREGTIKDQGLRQRVASYVNMFERFADFSIHDTRRVIPGQSMYDVKNHVEGEAYVSQGYGNTIARVGW